MNEQNWQSAHAVESFIKGSRSAMDIVGSDSPVYLAGILLDERIRWTKFPHLVVLSKEDDVESFVQALQFFDPKTDVHILSSFDVSPYSGLSPSRKHIARRIGWLWKAAHAKPGEIFVATSEALLQKTLPFAELSSRHLSLKKNELLSSQFQEILKSWGYTQTPLVEDVGTYSLRGGIVDVFSPAHDQPVRLELFGDVIDSCRFFDPSSQRSEGECLNYEVVPPTEIQFTTESRQRASKYFQGVIGEQATDSDEIQNIKQHLSIGAYQPGMEFLLDGFY